MTSSIGLCVIGSGAIAARHMQAFEEIGGIAPRWIVSDREDAARDFAHRWRFTQAGTSLAQALADAQVNLVLIASPSALHSEQASFALQAGKDVIVEIPVGLTLADVQRVAAIAKSERRRVFVCHTMRSRSALRAVREQVQSGQLHLTHITGFAGIPRRRNQGMDNIGTRSWIDNLLWHHGCHQIDTSLWVLGMPCVTQVQALFGPTHPTLGMVLDVGVQLLTAGGILVTQSLSYNVEHSSWRMQFIGHEDVLTFDNGRVTNEAGKELGADAGAVDCTVQNREVLRALQTGQPCEFDLGSVLPTMDVLDRAQRTAAAVSLAQAP